MRGRYWTLLAGLAGAVAAAGASMLVYGALIEANRLVLERRTLRLKGWPARLSGYRIAVLGDFHVRDEHSVALAQRAIALALGEAPDMVVLTGDLVSYWRPQTVRALGELLEPLLLMEGAVVAVPGNHDYEHGSPDLLEPILDELNIKLLRNESWTHAGITWVGIDSAKMGQDDAQLAFEGIEGDPNPKIAVWHEPDMVDFLPEGCVLQISGHSHGGQFRFPGGYTPMHSDLGRKYPLGFYPDAPTPLYVNRGIGTTGPPSRFNCAPEVTLLTLEPA
jgi:predicted MPP superfamily phosphohydrolase